MINMYRGDQVDLGLVAPSVKDGSNALGPTHSRGLQIAKRAMDVLGASLFLVLFLPLFVVVAVGVRQSSPGPILYTQKRAGRGGGVFTFYKFRSMRTDSEDALSAFLDSDPDAKKRWEQYQKVDNDPRITGFGRLIRRTSLDELPQFWNVLIGDMSLVGPRPCMLQQKELYGDHWQAYCAVRPGITGLWQVSGRNRLTYRQRVALDVSYVRSSSIWGDVKILVRTVSVVVRAQDAH
jgi:exopolysaccharide production protein ExoY